MGDESGRHSPTPDSWETADIEKDFAKVHLNLSSNVTSNGNSSGGSETLKEASRVISDGTEVAGKVAQEEWEGGEVKEGREWGGAVNGKPSGLGESVGVQIVESVDEFLRDALQNPRDRMTILRMEQEVEKFIKDPSQKVMEFQPMSSSYYRAAAHRVAQHYSLLTSAIDCGDSGIVVARKPGEIRLPTVRLFDVPPGPAGATLGGSDGAGSSLDSSMKVVLKQRQKTEEEERWGVGKGPSVQNLGPAKSVEERKEDYNRARARIFNHSLGGFNSDEEGGGDVGTGDGEAGERSECIAGQAAGGRSESVSSGMGSRHSSGSSVDEGRIKGEGEKGGRGGAGSGAVNGGGGVGGGLGGRGGAAKGKGRHVAILRDREKEKQDPDYRRGVDRLGPRFEPGFGMQQVHSVIHPYGVQPLYAPLVTYNTEFPSLGPNQPHLQQRQPPILTRGGVSGDLSRAGPGPPALGTGPRLVMPPGHQMQGWAQVYSPGALPHPYGNAVPSRPQETWRGGMMTPGMVPHYQAGGAYAGGASTGGGGNLAYGGGSVGIGPGFLPSHSHSSSQPAHQHQQHHQHQNQQQLIAGGSFAMRQVAPPGASGAMMRFPTSDPRQNMAFMQATSDGYVSQTSGSRRQ